MKFETYFPESGLKGFQRMPSDKSINRIFFPTVGARVRQMRK